MAPPGAPRIPDTVMPRSLDILFPATPVTRPALAAALAAAFLSSRRA